MALLVILQTDEPERLRSALALAAATAARDEAVTLLWEGPALTHLVAGGLSRSEETWPEGVDSPALLHATLIELPSVKQLACPTAVAAAGLTEEAVAIHVDALLGLSRILEETEGARLLYV